MINSVRRKLKLGMIVMIIPFLYGRVPSDHRACPRGQLGPRDSEQTSELMVGCQATRNASCLMPYIGQVGSGVPSYPITR